MSAIRLNIKKAEGQREPNVSRFLGNPVLPDGWVNSFPKTVMFFMQINLADIAKYDKENRLPHKGYLYFFLDTADGEYDLEPIVRYYDGEPLDVVDNFNELVPGYEQYVNEYIIEFEECEDDTDGIRLLGVPNDWNYAEEARQLLLQFDPLTVAEDIGIFANIDGLFYFFLNEGEEFHNEVVDVELMEEFS